MNFIKILLIISFLTMSLPFAMFPTMKGGEIYVEIDPLVISTFENSPQAYVSVIIKDDYGSLDLKDKTRTQVIESLRTKAEYLGKKIPKVLSTLSEEDFKLDGIYVFNDGFYGNITRKGIEKIRENPSVSKVYLNSIGKYILDTSVPLINATSVWTIQISGKNITGLGGNTTVCVIDSGVNYSHTDLGGCNLTENISDGSCGKVIGGYNYFENNGNPMDFNGHGTIVAGIVAANGYLKGVAPDAKIVALKNGNSSPDDARTASSVGWCINNSYYYNISIITISSDLSVYAPPSSSANCYPERTLSTYIETARQAGIIVLAASGNEGYTDKIVYPACTNATSVGATYDGNVSSWSWEEDANCEDPTTEADQIACATNRASILDLLTPGAPIYSTYYDGGYANAWGTSEAAPHVAGAAALLIQYEELKNNRTLKPAQIEQRFKDTGKLIFDNFRSANNGSGSNLTFSRIDVYSALFPIDVFDLQRLKASYNHNIFSFKIQNNYNNQTKNVSWSFDVGNGTTINSDYNVTLLPKKSVFVYFEYNYTDGDIYTINATASSGEDSDSETMTIPIGELIAYDMRLLSSSARERVFGFKILNNMNETKAVNWTLNTGQGTITSDYPVYLNSSKTVFVYAAYNYTSSGSYTVNATATSGSITDSTRNIEIDV